MSSDSDSSSSGSTSRVLKKERIKDENSGSGGNDVDNNDSGDRYSSNQIGNVIVKDESKIIIKWILSPKIQDNNIEKKNINHLGYVERRSNYSYFKLDAIIVLYNIH